MSTSTLRKSLRTQAYERLEEMIVTQVLKPGSTVTEQQLADRTGIGRTPIREALQRIAREGLVSIRPRSAIVILEMTLERQLQLLEVRGAVQELTVRSAAKRADVDERAKMLQLASAVDDAARIGDLALYMRIALDIHTLLCDTARNEFLSGFLSSLYALSRQFYFAHMKKIDLPQAAATHSAILRAVAALDEEAAAKASQQMIAFLYNVTEGQRRETSARQSSKVKTKPEARRKISATGRQGRARTSDRA